MLFKGTWANMYGRLWGTITKEKWPDALMEITGHPLHGWHARLLNLSSLCHNLGRVVQRRNFSLPIHFESLVCDSKASSCAPK